MLRARSMPFSPASSDHSVSSGANLFYAGSDATVLSGWGTRLAATRQRRRKEAAEWEQTLRFLVPGLTIAILLMLWCSGMPLFSR